MKVVVLGGGDSSERDVSLRSAQEVSDALTSLGHEVLNFDTKDGYEFLDEIDKNLPVFPILHGKNGEDGVVQKELEKRSFQYLGSDSDSSANCFDKWKARKIIESAGFTVARGELVSEKNYLQSLLYNIPHILKNRTEGSSIGIHLARNDKERSAKIDNSVFRDGEAIIEEFVAGTEVTVAILDKEALPVVEIIPPEGEVFNLENKYNGRTKEICPPKSLKPELQNKLKVTAIKIHNLLGCRHLSRVDAIVTNDGRIIILEINTMPGMTQESIYPKAAKAAGLDMQNLVQKFLDFTISKI